MLLIGAFRATHNLSEEYATLVYLSLLALLFGDLLCFVFDQYFYFSLKYDVEGVSYVALVKDNVTGVIKFKSCFFSDHLVVFDLKSLLDAEKAALLEEWDHELAAVVVVALHPTLLVRFQSSDNFLQLQRDLNFVILKVRVKVAVSVRHTQPQGLHAARVAPQVPLDLLHDLFLVIFLDYIFGKIDRASLGGSV